MVEKEKEKKIDIAAARDLVSIFDDLDDASKKYLDNMDLTKNALKEQTIELGLQTRELELAGVLTKAQADMIYKTLYTFGQLEKSSKMFSDNVSRARKDLKESDIEKLAKSFDTVNGMIGKVSSSLSGIGKSIGDIAIGFSKSRGAGVTAGLGALLELAVAVNKEFVEMNKQAITVGGSLGKLALPGRAEPFTGFLQKEVREATAGLTFTYGREITKEMIGAGAGIGIAPSRTPEIEYIGAVSRIIGTDISTAAQLVADISVKTGKSIASTAVVFQQFGEDFDDIRENVKMSFEEYVAQVMNVYERTRLYGGSLEEATAITKTFASELRTGTLSMGTLTNILTTGGKSPTDTFKALGWLGAMGMTVSGSVGGTAVSEMSPVAQSMAIFTNPKIQDALISQLMTAGQKFGAQMGYGGAEGKLIGEYFQREFVSQVFGVNLGASEWKTFQEKVMPALAAGVPATEAMAGAGLQTEAAAMADYITDWRLWASESRTWEDKVESLLQIMALHLGIIPGTITALASGLASLFPNIEARMFDTFTLKAEGMLKGVLEAKAAGELTTTDYERAIESFKALTEAFPKIGLVASAVASYGLMFKSLEPTAETSLAGYDYGTSYVPATGMYTLHKGEEVVSSQSVNRGASIAVNLNIGRLDSAAIEEIGNLAKEKVISELRRQALYEPAFGV